MTRLGANEYRDGRIRNGFDYAGQAQVLEEIIQPRGHPETMRAAKATLGVAAVVWEEGCRHCLACGVYSKC